MALVLVWLLLVGQRLFELQIAKRNVATLKAQGAVEYGASHYPVMVGLHSLWFVAWLWEGWGQGLVWLWKPLAALVLLGQFFRWTSILTLGRRWTTRVLVLPGAAPIRRGFYRWIPHPNYVGVCLELACVPLMFGAWRTALVFSVANALLLKVRIGIEERALRSTKTDP